MGKKQMKPKSDIVFQRLFGQEGQEKVTKKFLERILGIEIKSLSLDTNKRLIGNYLDDKVGRIDVHAKLNDGQKIIIEMQARRFPKMSTRMLLYWAGKFASGVKKGEPYSNAKKTIGILIADYDIDETKGIPEFHTKWNMREEKHPEYIFSEDIEMHIIELKKIENAEEDTPEIDWLRFIKEGEVDMKKDVDEELKEARAELKRLTSDPRMQELYEDRIFALMDEITLIEDGYERGIKAGEERGQKKGKAEGKNERNKEIIKAMHQNGIEIDVIVKITGQSKEEIEKIIKEDR